jgi:hypothetical protein
MRENRNAYRISMGKQEEKRPLGKQKREMGRACSTNRDE